MERDQAGKFVNDLLKLAKQKKASDLFITPDFPPALKIDGKITPQTAQPLTAIHTAEIARALELGYRKVTFCAVERPAEHPLKPANYRPLDAFWQRRGFSKRPDLVCAFTWRDLGQPQETPKPMVFWVKQL